MNKNHEQLMTSIELIGIKKIYNSGSTNETSALKGIDFKITGGKIYGLIGPNGAGKTTLLRILSTVITPTTGTAYINGLDIRADKIGIRRRMGFISNTTGLYDRLTPREMLRYFGHLNDMSENGISERTEELVTMLKMESFIDKKNELLSQGQKQRVSIARSMIHSPDVFILDEPTNGLDVITSRTIIDFIRFLRREKKLVLIATHDMPLARKICDEFIYINDGRVFAQGNLEEFQKRYGTDDLEDIFQMLTDESEEKLFTTDEVF